MKVPNSLFLRQSYLDAWDDYQRALLRPSFARWDYVLLTASNEDQARAYELQLSWRRAQGLLPPHTHFAVLSDPGGERVGSGGATLGALAYLRSVAGLTEDFENARILLIHSGGDSRRIPQYSACGKLFSPVPRELPGGRRSTLFDEFLIGMSGVPGRMLGGMLVLSGDVLLLFNPLQIDHFEGGAAAISFKEHVRVGRNHGVFLRDENGDVAEFLHKLPPEKLRAVGAVGEGDTVDIDTGAILLAPCVLRALFGLIATQGAPDPDKLRAFVSERARLSFYADFLYPMAGRATLDQYLRETPEGAFCEQLTACREALWHALHDFRIRLFRLSPAAFIHFGTTRELLGLMGEQLDSFSFLDWKRHVLSSRPAAHYAANGAAVSRGATIGAGSYLEDCLVQGGARVGEGCVLSCVSLADESAPDARVPDMPAPDARVSSASVPEISVRDTSARDTSVPDISVRDIPVREISVREISVREISVREISVRDISAPDISVPDIPVRDTSARDISTRDTSAPDISVREISVPDGTVLSAIPLRGGGWVVRAYGVGDNPKATIEEGATYLGRPLSEFALRNALPPELVWPKGARSLWTARLFKPCESMAEAVRFALYVCALARGEGDPAAFLAAPRLSLSESFERADAQAILDWQAHVRDAVREEALLRIIDERGTYRQAQALFAGAPPDAEQQARLVGHARGSDVSRAIRIYFFLGKVLGGAHGERYIDACFAEIRRHVLASCARETPSARIVREEATIRLPLRVNFGGGWSDTPPYCQECGGGVLNAAVRLGEQLPVEVVLRRQSTRAITLESADLGARHTFERIGELQDCDDPFDPFSLHKAALIACGVIPSVGGSLAAVLEGLGGGLYLSTRVRGVPKGSGLGTSSILAAACVQGIDALLGRETDLQAQYARVLCMEQLMSTGGGWQDQVGGMTPGVKFAYSLPGAAQTLHIVPVRVPAAAMRELSERFALIYTGQRRLARHLLRDVVGKYLGGDAEAIRALREIQGLAARMRFELERGDIDAFAALLSEHWEYSKALDQGSTNACIDHIFRSVEDLLAGHMMCGAGGGGFLQVVLRRGVTRAELRARLREVFYDSGVDVWACEFV